jgi:hypothetical protein
MSTSVDGSSDESSERVKLSDERMMTSRALGRRMGPARSAWLVCQAPRKPTSLAVRLERPFTWLR